MPTPQAPTTLALLAGPQLLGFFFDWGLQGVLSVQLYLYYLLFSQDSSATKFLVYGTFVYEWVQTILVTQTAFQIDVYGYGDRSSLTTFHNTWFSVTIMCAVISGVIQGYFCWRIFVLSHSRLLAGTIMFLSLGQMSVGIAGGAMLNVVNPTATESSAVTPVISSWLAGAAFVDIIIALVRMKSGIKQSDAIVNRIAGLVIGTGTLTATVAIVNLVCFTVISDNLVYQCPALVLAKLYANTLLFSLNNRAIMRYTGHSTSVAIEGSLAFVATLPSFPSLATTSENAPGTSSDAQMRGGVSSEEYGLRDVHDIVLQDAMGSEGKDDSARSDTARRLIVGREEYAYV